MKPRPDYGIDAPGVLRNLFLFGIPCLLLGLLGPQQVHLSHIIFLVRPMFFWAGLFLILEGCLFLLYVKYGKFRHRDRILSFYSWRGDEQVLDVGCGRGLLLAAAARKLTSGRAMGIDIWSNVDMAGNAEAATLRNLEMEGVSSRCDLLSVAAQEMPFPDATFDVVVSNLCLHNIEDRSARLQAVQQIARVLKPGGMALLSDYKNTRQYADALRRVGLTAEIRWGNPLYTFPPLRIVVAKKPSFSTPILSNTRPHRP
jgi:arsenite methyltransferase